MVKDEPTPEINKSIRFNNHYILWYRSFAVLIVSLIIPLILLGYWNFNTLLVMIRRRRLRNRPPNNLNRIGTTVVSFNNSGSISSNGTSQATTTLTMERGIILNQTRPDQKAHQGSWSILNTRISGLAIFYQVYHWWLINAYRLFQQNVKNQEKLKYYLLS